MNAERTRIVYFVPECQASRDSILHSQVLRAAAALEKDRFECMVVASDRGAGAAAKARELPAFRGISRAFICDRFPEKASFRTLWRLAGQALRAGREPIEAFRPDIVYTRNTFGARHARRMARALGAVHVHDVRGLPADEAAYKRGRMTLGLRALRRYEISQIRKADRVLCVSHRLADWIRREVGREDAFVIPCCIDSDDFGFRAEARRRIRRELQWPDDVPVAIYCGSLSAWQRIDDVLALIAEAKAVEPAIKALFLTNDPARLTEAAERAGLARRDFEARSVPHGEVPDWMSAGDAGIILRHNVLINNVASPVKIAEYLACGLPVICTAGIGDFSEMIRRENAGLVLQEGQACGPEVAALMKRAAGSMALRNACQALARRHLSWQAYRSVQSQVFARKERT